MQHAQDLAIINSHHLTQQLYSVHLPRGLLSKHRFDALEQQLSHDLKSTEGRKARKDAEQLITQYRDCELRRLGEMTGLIMALSRELEAEFGRLDP